MEDDELEDLLNDDPTSNSMYGYVPKTSTITKLQEAKAIEQQQIHALCHLQHQQLLEKECLQLTKRLTKFELLRAQEECVRFHTQYKQSEIEQGNQLANDLISEYLCDAQRNHQQQKQQTKPFNITYVLVSTVFSSQISPPAPEATRRYVESYFNDYQHLLKVTQNLYFPWQSFDENIFQSVQLLFKQNKIDDCRTYLLGYIECIARIPVEDQTLQGRQCVATAGTALGRHPFGSFFAKFLVAMKIVLMRIAIGSLTAAIIKAKIHDFVSLTSLVWDLSWGPALAAEARPILLEIVTECIQHIVFISLPEVKNLCVPKIKVTPPAIPAPVPIVTEFDALPSPTQSSAQIITQPPEADNLPVARESIESGHDFSYPRGGDPGVISVDEFVIDPQSEQLLRRFAVSNGGKKKPNTRSIFESIGLRSHSRDTADDSAEQQYICHESTDGVMMRVAGDELPLATVAVSKVVTELTVGTAVVDAGEAVYAENAPSPSNVNTVSPQAIDSRTIQSHMFPSSPLQAASSADPCHTPMVFTTPLSMLQQVCDVPAKYITRGYKLGESPFVAILTEFAYLAACKTPVEIVTVLTNIFNGVVTLASRIAIANGHSAQSMSDISTDELLPLLVFCTSLHLHTYSPMQAETISALDPTPVMIEQLYQLLVSMAFVDQFLPDHYRVRQEGFCIAVFGSSLHATPFRARLEQYATSVKDARKRR